MTNRTARFPLVVFASFVASASIALVLVNTADAADECLVKPKAETPQGQHWRYRLDRGTKRQCWYLRDINDAASQALALTPSDKAAALDRKSDAPLARSTADAYAALSSPGARADGGSRIPPVTQAPSIVPSIVTKPDQRDPKPQAATSGEPSPVASRWPDSAGVLSPTIERAAMAPVAVAATTPDPVADMDAATVVAVASSDSEQAPLSNPAVSVQTLLVVAFGAFTFAGLLGGLIHLVRARRRSQPGAAVSGEPDWAAPDGVEAERQPAWLHERSIYAPRVADAPSAGRPTSSLSGENGQEIARLLAQFANHPEAEGGR